MVYKSGRRAVSLLGTAATSPRKLSSQSTWSNVWRPARRLCDLQWDQIDFARKTIRVRRVKNGDPSTHYLSNSELRALRRLQRENPPGPHVFVSERRGPVTSSWFRKMMARLGERASMPFGIHPHMLRHSCGFKFADAGSEPRDLGVLRIFRHVDQRSMSAGVVQTGRKQPLHAQPAHVAERHRGAGGLLGIHSITSSARARTDAGMVMPSVFALFRLITSSNTVGCSIGSSAGEGRIPG
jgi:hypothetical protein